MFSIFILNKCFVFPPYFFYQCKTLLIIRIIGILLTMKIRSSCTNQIIVRDQIGQDNVLEEKYWKIHLQDIKLISEK